MDGHNGLLSLDAPAALRADGVQRVRKGRFLGLTGPMGRRVLKFDGPLARGLWYRPQGDEYKVSVTGLAFYVIWHEKHSADWLAALATPYRGCAIGHTFGVRVDGASSPCDCPTACGGKVVRSTKGGKGY